MNRLKFLIALLCLLPQVAAADELDTGDTAWILVSTALVLMMSIPGLMLFYAGLVRFKNTISVLVKTFMMVALMSVLWVLVGYSLAFSGDGAFIGNLDKVALRGVTPDSLVGTIPESVFVMFQATFAVITPALMIGAYVERVRFGAVVVFSALWLLCVYVPVTHWIWGGGFLAEDGVMDFAGGLVVHATAGVSALVLLHPLGKREKFPIVLSVSSPMITAMGAALLWVGWFGFNGGSALAANGSAGMAILVTHISAAMGALVWIFLERQRSGKSGIIAATTGVIAGLATVTPASGFIGVPGAFVLGLLGGAVCYYAVIFIRLRLRIDDSLDVFAVHGVGGILGSLLVAFLATDTFSGLGLAEGVSALSQFGVQLKAMVIVVVWSVGISWLLAWGVDKVIKLRVTQEQEAVGLDEAFHGERGFYW